MGTAAFQFPADFLWGAATAAYQVEGSPLADGAGVSNWHRFSHTPGRVRDGDTGDMACDQYRRYPEDIALMKRLGLQSYRFSIAWGRVLPEGTGRINAAGLAHYDRLVDALLEAGIKPNATLFHWDLPAVLDDRGGWLNPDSAEWFAEYSALMVKRLGDRVPMWATLNEPWVVVDAGYLHGIFAPGHRSHFEAAIVARNIMRAHGRGVQAARAEGVQQIGLVVNLEPKYPASDSAADAAAAARADAYMNQQFMEPAMRGSLPQQALAEVYGEAWQDWRQEDLALVNQPIDFLGINYYTRSVVRDDASVWLTRAGAVPQRRATHTEMAWEVCPQAFEDLLVDVSSRYPDTPIYITENGSAFYDPPVAAQEPLADPQRVEYLQSHLRAVASAMQRGARIQGYYAWSLLDNMEWAQGYSKRFGLVHVDHVSQKRTLKTSALSYAQTIAAQGTNLYAAS